MYGNINTAASGADSRTGQGAATPARLAIIMTSIGGFDGISQIVGSLGLGRGLDAAVLVFADVRRGFASILARRLASEHSINATELSGKRPLEPGDLVVIASQSSVEITAEPGLGQAIMTEVSPDEHVADYQVRVAKAISSAVDVYGSSVSAVMLSSMAGEQLEGLAKIKDAGGKVLCQSTEGCLICDGPRALVDRKIADAPLPVWALGGHLLEAMGSGS